MSQQKVLNVGGNNKAIPIPAHYQGFEHLLLDIDPIGKPDVLCDARELGERPSEEFDAIYCSHNLEHYFAHDVKRVLAGFMHVLKPGGLAEIRVPDLLSVMRAVLEKPMLLTDTLYTSPAGPITPLDVFYGFGKKIESSGVDFFAHKTGFSVETLGHALAKAGFGPVYGGVVKGQHEIRVYAFKGAPGAHWVGALKLRSPVSA